MVSSPDLVGTTSLMLDTGAQPNLIKIGTLHPSVLLYQQHTIKLTGITENIVKTLGIVKISFSNIPVTFHVVPDDFPIIPQGILGTAFFSEHNAQIDFQANCLYWRNQIFPFKKYESIVVPARTNVGFVIRIANPEIRSGYLPRLHTIAGVFIGDSLVSCSCGKAFTRAINTTDQEVELLIPTVTLREVSQISSTPPPAVSSINISQPLVINKELVVPKPPPRSGKPISSIKFPRFEMDESILIDLQSLFLPETEELNNNSNQSNKLSEKIEGVVPVSHTEKNLSELDNIKNEQSLSNESLLNNASSYNCSHSEPQGEPEPSLQKAQPTQLMRAASYNCQDSLPQEQPEPLLHKASSSYINHSDFNNKLSSSRNFSGVDHTRPPLNNAFVSSPSKQSIEAFNIPELVSQHHSPIGERLSNKKKWSLLKIP